MKHGHSTRYGYCQDTFVKRLSYESQNHVTLKSTNNLGSRNKFEVISQSLYLDTHMRHNQDSINLTNYEKVGYWYAISI